jgi:hypothetical protein
MGSRIASLALVTLCGCGGAAFTANDGAEHTDLYDIDAGQDRKTSSPEASREAHDGHDAVPNDADAGPAPEEADSSGGAGSTGGSGGTSGVDGSSGAGGSDGGVSIPCDGAGLFTHHTGTGSTWTDCVPAGTYDLAQAMKACKTSGAARCIDAQGCGAGNLVVIGYNAAVTQCVGGWGYGGLAVGFTSSVAYCSGCPSSASGPTWD